MDCTIRDGGLVNDHMFEDGFVKAIYNACVEAGIDYMEVGYKADKKVMARDKFGAWKFCDEDDIRRIVGDNPSSLKLSVMIDAGKSRLAARCLAEKRQRIGFDPRGILRQSGFRGRGYDQGRQGKRLRSLGQFDGCYHGQGTGNRPGAGSAGRLRRPM